MAQVRAAAAAGEMTPMCLGEIWWLFNMSGIWNHQQRFSEDVVAPFKCLTFSKYSSKSSRTSFTTGDPTTQYEKYENFIQYVYHNVGWLKFVLL